jgi:hypothetical protein
MKEWSQKLSTKDYVRGLSAIAPRVSPLQRRLLVAQYNAPGRRLTASELAIAADVAGGYPTVNAQYGRLGRLSCDYIGQVPDKRRRGNDRLWVGWSRGVKTGQGFVWQMLPSVARALEELGWVTPRGASGAVAQRLERVLPDRSTRRMLLSIFAESARYIRSRKPEWCLVRLNGKHLRLFAGRLIVLTLGGEEAWCATDPSVRSVDWSTLRSWRWDTKSHPRYKRVPSKNGYYAPRKDDRGEWADICGAHLAFLDRALAPGVAPDHRTSAKHDRIFGVPSFVYAGKLYWGQDRMHFLRSAVTRKSGRPS